MKLLMIVKFSLTAIKNRRVRYVLTILGIIIGPAVIVALVGATEGFSVSVRGRFEKLGTSTITATPTFGENFKMDDRVIKMLQEIDDVKLVVPYFRFTAQSTVAGKPKSITIYAIDNSRLSEVFPGVVIQEGGAPLSNTQALVGNIIAYPPEAAGQGIYINGVVTAELQIRNGDRNNREVRSYSTSGILQPFGQAFFINPDETLFIPVGAGKSLSRTPQQYSGAYVVAKNIDAVESVQAAITNLFGRGVRVFAVSSLISNIQSINSGIATILTSVAFMSVLVAFIGIMTTMFTSVGERTREIGVLKSLGYKPRHILGIFLTEATLTGAIGGVVGASMGAVLSYVVIGTFGGNLGVGGRGFGPRGSSAPPLEINPIITPELFFGAVVLSVVIGALAGLLPAWRASRLDPVQALRYE